MNLPKVRRSLLVFICVLAFRPGASAQSDQSIYSDSLLNGWQNYGWATLNYSNASPVHSGAKSISVSATAWQALYLYHSAFDTRSYSNLTFWIHGF